MTSWSYAEVFEAVATTQSEQPAIIQGDRTVTWGQFEERSRGIAAWLLSLNVTHQDKVALYLYNCPEYLEGVIASLRVGLVPVNTNYRYGHDELLYLWDNSDAAAVIFHGTFTDEVDSLRSDADKVQGWLWVDDGSGPCPEWATPYETHAASPPAALSFDWTRTADDLVMLYTGGTTGMPKGVMWRQDDLLCRMNSTGFRRWDLDGGVAQITKALVESGPGLALLTACPLMHGTGLFTALETLVEGGRLVMLEERHYDPASLAQTIDDKSINLCVIVGDPFARPLLEVLDADPDRYSLDSIIAFVSSGAMWSEEVKRGLLAHQPRMMLIDAFSSTEAVGMGNSVSRGDSSTPTGEFTLSDQVRVFDENNEPVVPGSDDIGVLALGGRNPLGYYKDDAKSAATFRIINGQRYSVPGDFAKVRADGTIQLLGRGSQCINTAGEKVFPEEVEEVLKRHVAVVDACVVGIPDPKTGERVIAAVELTDGGHVEQDDLIAHVRSHLAHYKSPRLIRIVPSIGRSPSGKVDYGRHTAEAVDWATSPDA